MTLERRLLSIDPPAAPGDPARPLILHVIHQLMTGGLENGLVNLINHMPEDRFSHAIVCVEDFSSFRDRLSRSDAAVYALHRSRIGAAGLRREIYRLCRCLRPAIVHSRNLSGLDSLPAAWLAGVPVRIHGEHGWDVDDPDGHSLKLRLLRRLHRPFVHQYIALSRHLQRYLVDAVGVPEERVAQIYNGVDSRRFCRAADGRGAIAGSPFNTADLWVVGAVGRLRAVKNQVLLARAFVRALALSPQAGSRLRLVIVGEGPSRAEIEAVLREAGVMSQAWFAGERNDVPEVLRGLDSFVLPSLAEGVSNTLLEAMATGLPTIATDVGGNAELVENGVSGRLVPSGDVDALAAALVEDFMNPGAAQARGLRARAAVEQRFSLGRMVTDYTGLYATMLNRAAIRGALRAAGSA